jgi:hypothetical protein
VTSVTLPASITAIPNNAFYECTALRNITLPATVTSIGSWAFYGCSAFTEVIVLNETPPVVGSSAFPNSVRTIGVPASAVDAYKEADFWSTYAGRIRAIDK